MEYANWCIKHPKHYFYGNDAEDCTLCKRGNMKDASFRVIYYPTVGRYTALAWNYDQAVLLGTTDFATYTEARAELDKLALQYNVNLKWFDGEYEVIDGQLVARSFADIYSEVMS